MPFQSNLELVEGVFEICHGNIKEGLVSLDAFKTQKALFEDFLLEHVRMANCFDFVLPLVRRYLEFR